jgi:hypothetical protein
VTETTVKFGEEIEATARQILAAVSSGKARTAWDLKMHLKVPHTRLHLALGMLLAQGSVTLKPERLTYAVEPAGAGSQAAV